MSAAHADFTSLREAFDDWSHGNTHTHEHYVVDETKFVGRVPALIHRRAEQMMMAFIPLVIGLVDDLAEDSDCSFDHNGDCQAHGWFGLVEDGVECPARTARRLVAAWGANPQVTPAVR